MKKRRIIAVQCQHIRYHAVAVGKWKEMEGCIQKDGKKEEGGRGEEGGTFDFAFFNESGEMRSSGSEVRENICLNEFVNDLQSPNMFPRNELIFKL